MWEVLDEMEKTESSGGAIIGKIEFGIGYKCFIAGMSNEDTFFPFDPLNKKGKEGALEKARALNEEKGGTGRPQVCVQFRVFKSDVLGREVTWKGDRFFSHPIWTPAYKEIVKPALKAAKVEKTGIYWGRIGFAPDHSGRQEVGQDVELRTQMVEHLVEVYKGKAEAQAAAGSMSSSENKPASTASAEGVPSGWDADSWAAVVPEIQSEIAKQIGDDATPGSIAKVLGKMAKDYGVTVADLKPLVAK